MPLPVRLDGERAPNYGAPDFEAAFPIGSAGREPAVASAKRPGETRHGGEAEAPPLDGDLDRRRRELDAAIAARRAVDAPEREDGKSRGAAGYGQALKLSSEFIAGIAVGAGLGWFIDRMAGTSPWGLIVFLLLGFGAGILNVLRSAGVVSEPGSKAHTGAADGPDRK